MRLCAGEASVGELANPFDMALPSFMKHIHVLELSGLVQSEKSGRVRTCRLSPDALIGAEDWFQQQRAIWEARSPVGSRRLLSDEAQEREGKAGRQAVVPDSQTERYLMMTSSANPALSQWSLDREIVMSRVIDAPRDLVFEAWSDPKHLPQWFGPKGFSFAISAQSARKSATVRVGGIWRHQHDWPTKPAIRRGYPNRMRFRRELLSGRRLDGESGVKAELTDH